MARARILVVDDEAGMLRTVERILAPQHEVKAMRVPSEAVEAARHAPFDVAVVDVRMPEMDGFDLMAGLKAVQPDLDVILMTGSVHEADARLIRAIREHAFFYLTKPFDRDVLLALVSRCLDLRRATAENRTYLDRLEVQFRAAQSFQEALLPKSPQRLGALEVMARYQPWAQLGGDFFDVTMDTRGVVLLIVDVSGHGAAAAMLTGMVKLAFHEAAPDERPDAIMQRIAACCRLFPDGRHLTGICARIDSDARRLEYVNAGHPPGLILGAAGRLERLDSTAILIHPALDRWSCEMRAVNLAPEDRLFLYTDGLIEARRAHDADEDAADGGELFGLDRLEQALLEPVAGGDALLDRVGERLTSFRAGRPLEDDVAMLLAECAR